jgi:arginyl-tRNA synthetase
MTLHQLIQTATQGAVQQLYQLDIASQDITVSPTRSDFEGEMTVTVFAFAKAAKKAPPVVGAEIGAYLVEHLTEVSSFNVIQGFLNLVIDNHFWAKFLQTALTEGEKYGQLATKNERVIVEYSSPNTNKPLHLGHIRNILLGWSSAKILEAAGYEVLRVKVVNDRGIAICKSMLAWQLFGNGETPVSSGMKGDHFVGKYYVAFEQHFRTEYAAWQSSEVAKELLQTKQTATQTTEEFFKAYKNEYFNQYSALGAQARQMLLRWEASDAETVALWQKMNAWVYEGFNETYQKLGVWFDKIYYESNTYLLGKEAIEAGLKTGIFYQKPDNSVWIDLTAEKLDHKIVLRSDGTSVYITQDIGMAQLRDKEFGAKKVAYVVADEQNYHFQVLFEILKKMGEPYAHGLFHLSYGMVELPTGRMKSREGTVVDADDLIAEVIAEVTTGSEERGSLPSEMLDETNRKIGLAALKYHILKVNPKKKMVFDPSESVELQGHTGPYIQYAYVRSNGVVRDALSAGFDLTSASNYLQFEAVEKELIQKIYDYPKFVEEAAQLYDPSVIANYNYDLAKMFNKFWHDCSILKESSVEIKRFRLQLSQMVAQVLRHSMDLLGVEMPERM